jgi:anti-sigma regulatory factor (Ser/Thr protein kinase)
MKALKQAFDRTTLSLLRAVVRAYALAAGIPRPDVDEIVIVVHEMAANAVSHGGGTGRLSMWRTRRELRCLIEDSGASPADPAAADPAAADPAAAGAVTGREVNRVTGPMRWPREPGHGLWLADQVASRMTAVTGPRGSRVTLAFALGGA